MYDLINFECFGIWLDACVKLLSCVQKLISLLIKGKKNNQRKREVLYFVLVFRSDGDVPFHVQRQVVGTGEGAFA